MISFLFKNVSIKIIKFNVCYFELILGKNIDFYDFNPLKNPKIKKQNETYQHKEYKKFKSILKSP